MPLRAEWNVDLWKDGYPIVCSGNNNKRSGFENGWIAGGGTIEDCGATFRRWESKYCIWPEWYAPLKIVPNCARLLPPLLLNGMIHISKFKKDERRMYKFRTNLNVVSRRSFRWARRADIQSQGFFDATFHKLGNGRERSALHGAITIVPSRRNDPEALPYVINVTKEFWKASRMNFVWYILGVAVGIRLAIMQSKETKVTEVFCRVPFKKNKIKWNVNVNNHHNEEACAQLYK